MNTNTNTNTNTNRSTNLPLYSEGFARIRTSDAEGVKTGCLRASKNNNHRKGYTMSITFETHRNSVLAYIDIEAFIEATLEHDETMQAAYDHFTKDSEDWTSNDIEAFIENIGFHSAVHDNSCNAENDLSNEIDYVIATSIESDDYIYPEGKVLIFLRVHQGGDVRCNYSSVKVYTYTDYDQSNFFRRNVSWNLYDATDKEGNELTHDDCCALSERWGEGYTSNPTYELEMDIETCELDASGEFVNVVLKDGTKGKICPSSYALNL